MKKQIGLKGLLLLLLVFAVPLMAQNIDVAITTPSANTQLSVGGSIFVEASATATTGNITGVDLYYNGVRWGAMSFNSGTSSYSWGWGQLPDGVYELTARAMDDQGNSVASDPVTVTVGAPAEGQHAINGEFNVSQWPWIFDNYNGAVASFAIDPNLGLTADSSGASITYTSTAAIWEVQLFQRVIVEAGHTYEISFAAAVPEAKPVEVAVSLNYGTYAPVWAQGITLDPAVQQYGPYTFDCTDTDSNMVFKFVIGGNTIPMDLDAVKLVDVTQTPPPPVEVSGILVDFGPDDVTNGNTTPSPDANGNYWNNVVDALPSGTPVDFVDNANNPTGVSLTVTSEFFKNGINHGGLLSPDSSLLGEFAIPTATQDYFFHTGTASFKLSGLDPMMGYVLNMFGTRNTTTTRITQYDLVGMDSSSVTLQTSGTDLGGVGYNGNNSTVAVSDTVQPDANGEIQVSVSVVSGGFCYIGLMKVVEVELPLPPPVEVTGILVDFGPDDVTNGNTTPSPDANGNYWNNVVDALPSGTPVDFVDNANNPTGVSLTVTSEFFKNGINHGGLLSPDSSLLGEFAIPTATQDYFFHTGTASFKLSGLDPMMGYVLNMFGTRNTTTTRITQYDLVGMDSSSVTLQTSGTDLGGVGYNGNNSTVAVSDTVQPDANGEISVSVSVVEGGFCYIGLMKVVAVELPPPPVVASGVLIDFGPNDVINGNITASPDLFGNYWNNPTSGTVASDTVHLVDNSNAVTGMYLKVTSELWTNGIQNGGLLAPDTSLLGEFGIATATQDYFFQSSTGALKIGGLDNTKSYKFNFFGTRNSTEVRITNYKLVGANISSVNLQTSGPDLGGVGYHGNNSTIVSSDPVVPDANGEIEITLSKVQGSFCYLGVMQIVPGGDAGNLALTNTGFETGDLSNWLVSPPVNSASATVTNAAAYAGTYSMQLSGDSVTVSQTITGIIGDDYVLSGYFYNPATNPMADGQGVLLELNYFDGSNMLLKSIQSNVFSNADAQDQWTKLDVMATVPVGTASAQVVIRWNSIGTGAVLVDNISLEVYDAVVSPCTAYPQFTAERETVTYMEPAFNDTAWAVIDLPVDTNGMLKDNRTYWFRKHIDVPVEMASDSSFALSLCAIDGADAVWVNGVLVGESGFTNTFRNYTVPGEVIVAGDNVVVLQTGFVRDATFFNPTGAVMELQGSTQNVSVAGDWKVKQGIIFNNDVLVHDEYKLTVMGSSVADGYGAASNYGYAARYADLLQARFDAGVGADWQYSNISVGGNSTLDLLARWESDLLPECAGYVVYGLSLGNEGIHENGQAAFDQFRDNMQVLIQQARDYGIQPVVVNCYARLDFNAADYEFTKQMNLLYHEWDVPSINVLGAIDDGAGRWVAGFYADPYHPNTAGHAEMSYAIVPSLFDALDQGKPRPQWVEGTSLTIDNPGTPAPLQYEMDEIVHPFTVSFDVMTSSVGNLAGVETTTGNAVIAVDSMAGTLSYTAASGEQVVSTLAVNDNQWHKVTLTHYYARRATFLYVDSVLVGQVTERIIPERTFLGGGGFGSAFGPQSATYRNWMFWRSGMTEDEILALNNGALLQSSLELYAPLDGAGTDPLANLAQSTTTIIENVVDGIGLNGENAVPKKFALYDNYPNPFNPSTTIRYAIAKPVEVKLNVYNLLGERVASLVNTRQEPGYYNVTFDSRGLASGVYFFSLQAGDFSKTKKMVLLK